jgi:hypothetical protein
LPLLQHHFANGAYAVLPEPRVNAFNVVEVQARERAYAVPRGIGGQAD